MKLPNELVQAYQNNFRQFSWVFQLTGDNATPVSQFCKGVASYQGQRFFWQTPEKEFALVGFGKEAVFKEAATSVTYLNQFLREQTDRCYQNQTITGTGPLLFGGFPFDQTKPASENWGTMGAGLFYLPAILFTYTQQHVFVTFNFSADSEVELASKWIDLTAQFEQLQVAQEDCTEPTTAKIATKEVTVAEWLEVVEEAVTELQTAGPLKKVVLARQMQVSSEQALETNRILTNLLEQQQNTYFFALEEEAHTFIGATPERLLLGTETTFATACVAGSIRTGKTAAETQKLGEQLLQDRKNQKEHQIVVERIAKELAKITASESSIKAPMILENRDIQHLYVPIEGVRKPDVSFLESVLQLHPTPALGGEPKSLAMHWISQHEPGSRGLYGAPIGWVSGRQDVGEFAVGIRSGIFSKNQGFLYAGCGIVADSQAVLEREETKIKFQPMLRGIGGQVK